MFQSRSCSSNPQPEGYFHVFPPPIHCSIEVADMNLTYAQRQYNSSMWALPRHLSLGTSPSTPSQSLGAKPPIQAGTEACSADLTSLMGSFTYLASSISLMTLNCPSGGVFIGGRFLGWHGENPRCFVKTMNDADPFGAAIVAQPSPQKMHRGGATDPKAIVAEK